MHERRLPGSACNLEDRVGRIGHSAAMVASRAILRFNIVVRLEVGLGNHRHTTSRMEPGAPEKVRLGANRHHLPVQIDASGVRRLLISLNFRRDEAKAARRQTGIPTQFKLRHGSKDKGSLRSGGHIAPRRGMFNRCAPIPFPEDQGPHSVKFAAVVYFACVVASSLLLDGCDSGQPARPSAVQLSAFRPADAHLAQLYSHSCKSCHTKPESTAPLVHDRSAWNMLWSKGLSVLRDHTIVGFRAMPAGGQCTVCTPQEYENLIRFMADREGT